MNPANWERRPTRRGGKRHKGKKKRLVRSLSRRRSHSRGPPTRSGGPVARRSPKGGSSADQPDARAEMEDEEEQRGSDRSSGDETRTSARTGAVSPTTPTGGVTPRMSEAASPRDQLQWADLSGAVFNDAGDAFTDANGVDAHYDFDMRRWVTISEEGYTKLYEAKEPGDSWIMTDQPSSGWGKRVEEGSTASASKPAQPDETPLLPASPASERSNSPAHTMDENLE